MKAIWNGKAVAESSDTIVIEGNHYFPIESVNKDFLKYSDLRTTCPWKGEASYYDVAVDGSLNENAAWYYPNPKGAAKEIKNRVAFWHGVEITES